MADLVLLTCFVRAAEHGSFSAAARRLGVSAAAVSKNVAHLEAHVGVRLFHRSTRRLALTGGGERLLAQVRDPLASLDGAIASLRDDSDEPSGTLKVSMGQALGRQFLVPLLNEFLDRCPAVVPDWHFDDRRIDLVGEGFDAAVGGGFELAPAWWRASWRRCTSSRWPRPPTWPGGRGRSNRPTSPSWPASCGARRPADGCGRGRCARAATSSNRCRAARG
jgi:DNA-binding transcriptional LysR family regulator